MEQALWKILAFILAVVLIFVAPTINVYDRMDAITQTVVTAEVSRFCEGAKDTGIITQHSYNTLIKSLAATGVTYEVSLEHYEKIYMPSVTAGVTTAEVAYVPYSSYDIQQALDSNEAYKMTVGDLFYVHVKNTSPTKGQTIRQVLLGTGASYPVIVVRNGGMIRHEPD